ncbi:MAG: substrate-binding domain-containing protein [Blautia sp.]|nr:substrate-binding domain-containing protein [Blautia sp.]
MKKYWIPLLIAGLAVIATLFFWFFNYGWMGQIEDQIGREQVYSRHYLLISDDDSQLYRSIYESAKETANAQDAWLEWTYAGQQGKNSVSDLMQIGIASKVDGILLASDEKITDLIDEAAEKMIPTVTLLEDDSDSLRISFVGINGYQLGEIYAEQTLDLLQDGKNQIMVLVSSKTENINQNMILSRIKEIVGRKKLDSQEIMIQPYGINSTDSFDVEESIRDIFVNSVELPDILICLDAVATECAYQAIVDYNEVGKVKIIGYYASDTVLDAISKKLIPVTIDLNTEDIGKFGVGALTEYLDQGYVSNYFSVGLDIITEQTMETILPDSGPDQI